MEKTGKFVTLEGCEGVGKSTQLKLLQEYCEKNSIAAIFTREPGGTPISEQIRSIILNKNNTEMHDITELLLYNASRAQHVRQLIVPALGQGKIVFCDRFCDSTMAYQGYARGLDKQIVDTLNRVAVGGIKIDLTIFIDVSPSVGFMRKGGASEDRLEQENLGFFNKVYDGFCQIAKAEPDRVVSIKAAGSKKETSNKIIKILKERGIL